MPKVPYSLINKALQGRERRFAAGFQANYNEERGFILTNHNFIIYSRTMLVHSQLLRDVVRTLTTKMLAWGGIRWLWFSTPPKLKPWLGSEAISSGTLSR